MNKGLVILLILSLAACCKKKHCAGDTLPQVVVTFLNVNSTVNITQLTINKGIHTDSASYMVTVGRPSLYLYPVTDFYDSGANTRKIVIKRANKSDTIKNIQYAFFEDEIDCGSCFLSKPTRQKINRLSQFSFEHNAKTYVLGDTLKLN